ncbi:MAG: ABC transporter ATP-binding protein [Planctomycetota bacterium]|jgi:ATP-binding cassette subfamily B protein
MTRRRHKEESFKKGLNLGLWRRLLGFARPYRRAVAVLAGCAMAIAFFDTAFPLLTKWVIDDLQAHGTSRSFLPHAAVFGVLTLGLCLSIWGFIHVGGKIRTFAAHDIRRAGFEKLQLLSFSFFDRRPVGWLMARMTSDCERLSNILAWGILDSVWGVTVLTGFTIAMFYLDAKLALLVLVVLPPLFWISAIFRRRILKTARAVRKTNSRITASYNESIMGVRTTKVFVREEENLGEFSDLTGEMYRASVRNQLHSALFLPIVLTLGSVATAVALSVGGLDVTVGRISLGTLFAFLAYSRQFFDPVHELAYWFAELQMAQASAERILGLIDTEPEIKDSEEVARAMRLASAEERQEGTAEDGHPDRIGDIEFRGVGFAYPDGPTVLRDFDLDVAPGETIALVGATGGGKTTIVNLLCRFYEPTGGEIRLDGLDYRHRSLAWLQRNLGIVLQEPHLFSGSVADNIRYGKLDATDEEIENAAELAGAHAFVSAMEDGYGSEVGEGGNRLSTGQKQLVSFARAILARPRILVMDEATSSVDTETEKRIQRGLERVLEGRTSFVIAHRLSTIRSADRILVIEHGRIMEEGSHRNLLDRRGRYHDLYTQQSLRESFKNGRAWG